MAIRWYSTDLDLRTVDHEALDLLGACAVIDRYFSQLRDHYDSGEEALAATKFGFFREDESYLEICIHARDHIDISSGLHQDERLTSRDEVHARTGLFFADSEPLVHTSEQSETATAVPFTRILVATTLLWGIVVVLVETLRIWRVLSGTPSSDLYANNLTFQLVASLFLVATRWLPVLLALLALQALRQQFGRKSH
jgi:hypothetical protein